jgi:hypothetical protein
MIGEILRKVLKKRNIPHTATDRRLLDLWTLAVGPQIAARTLLNRNSIFKAAKRCCRV